MRVKLLMGCVLAAGAAAAHGQNNVVANDFAVSVSFSDVVIGPAGDTIVIGTIFASWTGSATTYLSSFNIDLNASTDLVSVESTPVLNWANPALGWSGDESFAVGSSIIGIEGAQSSLFGPVQTGNPFQVATFSVRSLGFGGVLSYTASLAADAPFAFSVSDTSLPSANPAQFGVSSLQSDSLVILPSAPSVGVLAAAGLMATRRRRA